MKKTIIPEQIINSQDCNLNDKQYLCYNGSYSLISSKKKWIKYCYDGKLICLDYSNKTLKEFYGDEEIITPTYEECGTKLVWGLDLEKRVSSEEGMIYELKQELQAKDIIIQNICTEDNLKYNKYDWCDKIWKKQ